MLVTLAMTDTSLVQMCRLAADPVMMQRWFLPPPVAVRKQIPPGKCDIYISNAASEAQERMGKGGVCKIMKKKKWLNFKISGGFQSFSFFFFALIWIQTPSVKMELSTHIHLLFYGTYGTYLLQIMEGEGLFISFGLPNKTLIFAVGLPKANCTLCKKHCTSLRLTSPDLQPIH